MMTKRSFFVLLLSLSITALVAQPQRPAKGNQPPKEGAMIEKTVSSDPSFKFAQFTDLHISTQKEQNSTDLVNAINDVNNQKGIAFVIVTGDITEGGDLESLQLAKKMLSKLTVPYYVLPGNHDTKWSASGATDFKRVFGDDRFRIQMNGYIFLGVNSGPIIKMGDGHILPQDIYWLERQLKNAGKKSPIFIVTHYPLKNGDVDNWYAVTDLARKHNVQGVISGHYHRNMMLSYDAIPGIISRSVLRGDQEKGGYTLYTVADSLYIYEKPIGEEPIKWGALSVDPKMYVEGDSKLKPSYSVNSTYKQVKENWSVNIGSAIFSSPAVNDKYVFVGDNAGFIQALSLEKGKSVWKYKTLGRIVGAPTVAGDKLLFTSTDGNLYCLDANEGTLVWKVRSNRPMVSVPAVADGVVYVGASDGKFRALNLTDGSEIWAYTGVGNYVEARPTLTSELVIFGAWDSYLYALNRKDGTLVWRWNNGKERMHFSPAAVWPVVSGNKVYVTAPDRYLTAIDLATGETAWRTNTHQVRETIGISADANTIYSRTMTDSVFAYNVTTQVPEQRWITNAGFGYDHNPSMLIEKDGMVVFATKNGEIVAINSNDGSVRWKHKVDNVAIHTLVPVGNGAWIMTNTNGQVVRISEK